jgi:hypothetical protein
VCQCERDGRARWRINPAWFSIDGTGTNRWPVARCLANRRRIDRVVLVAPDPRVKPEGRLWASHAQAGSASLRTRAPASRPPMTRRRAGFHRHHTPRKLPEKPTSLPRATFRATTISPFGSTA